MRAHNRKPIRLDPAEYRGEKMVSFTACINDRSATFVDHRIYDAHVEFLRRAAAEFNCLVPIFCFMPDHAHILIKGVDFDSDPLATMRKFKSLSGIWLKRYGYAGWQESFNDHILRAGEWRIKAKYIAMNPVRAGLVENYTDYPYLGSLHGRVQDIFPD